MVKFVLLSILLFNVAFSFKRLQKWNVTILNENREKKPLEVIPGQFTKFYFSITTNEALPKLIPYPGTFKLANSSLFITQQESYNVLTLFSLEYEGFIGIPCGKQIPNETSQTIQLRKH